MPVGNDAATAEPDSDMPKENPDRTQLNNQETTSYE
jgi:hypothetical protein